VNQDVYEYLSDICVCPVQEIFIPIRTSEGYEVFEFPLAVHNVFDVYIGTANNKAEYMAIWNSDPDNQLIGTLSGYLAPFAFTLKLKPDQIAPDWVIGNPTGIYGIEYGIEYE
jgi:hypothetical protein